MFEQSAPVGEIDSAFFQLPGTLLLILDNEGVVQRVSIGLQEVLGHDPVDLVGSRFQEILHRADAEVVCEQLRRVAREGSTLRFQARCRHADESYLGLTFNTTTSAGLIYASAHPTAINFAHGDAEIPQSLVDPLTGLPNRTLFYDRLEHTWQRSQRRHEVMFAILQVGVDRFKLINESLGHRLGDLLLSHIGIALRACIRPTDMVARLGGDEFALLLEDIRDASSALRVVNRIQQRLVLPFNLNGHEVYSSVSVGITISGNQDNPPEQYLRDADIAMRRAKRHGGAGYVVFDKAMHSQAVQRLEIEMDLRKAIEHRQLEAYFQPIMRLSDGALTGFEALARWRHPRMGLVPPVRFIPVAEETGQIMEIGRWMTGQACLCGTNWNQEFGSRPTAIDISVNLSPRQLGRDGLVEEIDALLEQHQFPASQLKLEITESALLENPEVAIEQLNRLRSIGVRLSLDDFGTGYSSLSYLHKLPIDLLKIDRSFVSGIDGEGHHRTFVETILNLARHLGLEVVCEGVENEEQALILRELGCDYAQGYLYSRPVAESEARILIAARTIASRRPTTQS
jgi:diguanylate cyclase (GGDEF)-like protein